MKEKLYTTWQDVEVFVRSLAKCGRTFSGVYGLPRGGLTLAVMLSHCLGIPMLAAPCKGCLIVDDICDSGESLLHYVKNTSNPDDDTNYCIATLYKKESSPVSPDFIYDEVPDDVWIVFPWEVLPEHEQLQDIYCNEE